MQVNVRSLCDMRYYGLASGAAPALPLTGQEPAPIRRGTGLFLITPNTYQKCLKRMGLHLSFCVLSLILLCLTLSDSMFTNNYKVVFKVTSLPFPYRHSVLYVHTTPPAAKEPFHSPS